MSDASDRREYKRLKAQWLAVGLTSEPTGVIDKLQAMLCLNEVRATAIDISLGGMGVLTNSKDFDVGDIISISVIYASQMRDDDMISIRNVNAVVRNYQEFSGAFRYGLEFIRGSSKKLAPIFDRIDC